MLSCHALGSPDRLPYKNNTKPTQELKQEGGHVVLVTPWALLRQTSADSGSLIPEAPPTPATNRIARLWSRDLSPACNISYQLQRTLLNFAVVY